MNNKTLNAQLEINANQKRKLAAKNKERKEQAAKIDSLEKQLKREARRLKQQIAIVAYQSGQMDKLKASNKKLRKELKDFKIPILEHQAALEQSSREIKQLQQELAEEKQRVARLNLKLIESNKTTAPPQRARQSPTPTTRLFNELELGTVPPYEKPGGTAGALGKVSHRAKHH